MALHLVFQICTYLHTHLNNRERQSTSPRLSCKTAYEASTINKELVNQGILGEGQSPLREKCPHWFSNTSGQPWNHIHTSNIRGLSR